MHFNHTHPCSFFPAPLRPHHHYSSPHILFCSLLNPLSWICAAHIHMSIKPSTGIWIACWGYIFHEQQSPANSSSIMPPKRLCNSCWSIWLGHVQDLFGHSWLLWLHVYNDPAINCRPSKSFYYITFACDIETQTWFRVSRDEIGEHS